MIDGKKSESFPPPITLPNNPAVRDWVDANYGMFNLWRVFDEAFEVNGIQGTTKDIPFLIDKIVFQLMTEGQEKAKNAIWELIRKDIHRYLARKIGPAYALWMQAAKRAAPPVMKRIHGA